MALALCPLDRNMNFDFAVWETKPCPLRHILVVEGIVPVSGLFRNAITKIFYQFSELHFEIIDEFDIVDGKIKEIPKESENPKVLLELGLQRLKEAGASEVLFAFGPDCDEDILQMAKGMSIPGLKTRFVGWEEVACL